MKATHAPLPALGSLLILALAAAPAVTQEMVFDSELHDYRVVTVFEGLQDPWSMAFLPGGDMLITERIGNLRIAHDGVLHPDPIDGVPEVRYMGQGGLLDVALHPDFASNQLVYLSFSKPNADGTEGTTAVVRGRLDGHSLVDVEEVFEADAWSSSGSHFGSRLAFDPDGYLFITVGDRGVNPLSIPVEENPAQDPSNHIGSTIRLHADGSVPDDNPFVGQAGYLPEIWSYGHRNPQGMAIHPATGEVWQTEHGPQGGDELNLVLPGRNYGWPVIGYGVQYGGNQVHEGTHREGMEQPVTYWTPSIATSGLMIYTGDRFPEWNGHIFAGGLAGQQLHRIALVDGENGWEVQRMERRPLLFGVGRIRDVRQGPDGLIYVALDDRQGGGTTPILRIEPLE